MDWKLKSLAQNLIATLPGRLAPTVYRRLQRFGRLRRVDPSGWLDAAAEAGRLALAQGRTFRDATVLEVGTGWLPIMPLAFWLMGARQVVTVDLNPLMEERLLDETLRAIAIRAEDIARSWGDLLDTRRMERFLRLLEARPVGLEPLCRECRIDYRPGVDAARTGLSDGAVDIHFSYTVLEHIPPDRLAPVLAEAGRVTHAGGLLVHRVDYTDHFSHTDPSLSSIHFLRFGERSWQFLAGNRFMYMNRLRHDDFERLFTATGHELLRVETFVSQQLLPRLKAGEIRLHERFAGKSAEVLATEGAWFVTRPAGR